MSHSTRRHLNTNVLPKSDQLHQFLRRGHGATAFAATLLSLSFIISRASAQDCNNNGIPDACDIACGATGGPCDIPGCGQSEDCNSNGIPDECDVVQPFLRDSGNLSPFSNEYKQYYTVLAPPLALSNVQLQFFAQANLESAADFVTIRLNDQLVGTIFVAAGADCTPPVQTTLSVPAATWNTARLHPTGNVLIKMLPSEFVGEVCGLSYCRVRVTYSSPLNDCNGNGVPDSCDIASSLSADCNSNAIPDECESDCNNNGIADSCDVAQGAPDCNSNLMPDTCDLATTYFVASPQLSPIDAATVQVYSVPSCRPATGDVFLWISARGDFGAFTETLDVRLNGEYVATLFQPDGGHCLRESSSGIMIPGAAWNSAFAVSGGRVSLSFHASPAVNAGECATSYVQVRVWHPFDNDCDQNDVPDDCLTGIEDCDGNGIPDSCELDVNDCNDNDTLDSCDIASGTSPDCNLNGTPDECDLNATSFSYGDFATISGLNLVGSAARSGSLLRLTPEANNQRGAAWKSNRQYVVNGFDTTFEFSITNTGDPGADGLVFVVQDASSSALGAYEPGYEGIPESLAIEFDNWQNTNQGDPAADHVSVHTRGAYPNSTHESASLGRTTNITAFDDGQIHIARIAYVPGTMAIYLDDLQAPILTVSIDLGSMLSLTDGFAWVGFTAGTGGRDQIHDMISWNFSLTDYDCDNDGVPDPCQLVGNDANLNGRIDACEPHGADDCNENGILDFLELFPSDRALQFFGGDDRVEIAHASAISFDQSASFTVEAWVGGVTSINSVEDTIIEKWACNATDPYPYVLRILPSGQVAFRSYRGSGTGEGPTSTATVNDGQWHHVAGVRTGTSSMRIYIDGVLSGEQTNIPSGSIANTRPVCMGGRAGGCFGLRGNIDEVRIWNVARTQVQIQQTMNQSLVGNEAGLAGYWRLDNGTGLIVSDSSPSANHGQAFGGAAWVPGHLAMPAPDCNGNNVIDTCEPDCNENGIPDECEFTSSGHALSFSGDFVRIANSPSLSIISSLTVETWATATNPGGFWQQLVFKGDQQSGLDPYYLRLSSGSLEWAIVGNGNVLAQVVTNVQAYDWTQSHHIAGVFDDAADQLRLYIDGELKVTGNATVQPLSNQSNMDLWIGAATAEQYYNGTLDEIRLWNVPRTQLQILDNMNRRLNGAESGLVGYWRFDEGAGQVVADASLAGNHGVRGNNTTEEGSDPTWVTPGVSLISNDCNNNSVLDECDIAAGTSDDCNANQIPDECESQADCNNNGIQDICDIAGGMPDCNANGVPDSCDIAAGVPDMNHDGVPDTCVFPLVCERITPCGNLFLTPDDATDSLRVFKRSGSPVAAFMQVSDVGGPIGTDADGNVMVPEWGNGRVRVISPTGSLVRTINTGGLSGPTGSAVTPNGNIAICSYLTDSVKIYGPSGIYLSNLAHANGTQDPQSLAFDRDGYLYVGCRNNGNPHVARFSPQLQFIEYLGQGQFSQGCTEIAFDVNENLYVVTSGSIKKFSHAGALLGTITQAGLSPLGMAIDETGVLWVTNIAARNIYRFDSSGQFVDIIPISFGANPPAALKLYGIAFDVRATQDCNANSTPDSCDIAAGTAQDCNLDGIPDSCQLASNDCNNNSIPDDCESGDCDENGIPDVCDILGGASDCNNNGILDVCELAEPPNRVFVTPVLARGWPTEHPVQTPSLSIDGNQSTYTWTTDAGNFVHPSYYAAAFGNTRLIDGIRMWKDNDGGGGANSKDLTIQYTTDAVVLPGSGNWQSVTGLTSGYFGAEQMVATAVNTNGTVVGDVHDSVNEGHGWASLRFNPIAATGVRIAFTFTGSGGNHYKVHEFHAFRVNDTVDCNNNNVIDSCDVAAGTSQDCNANNIPDECESQVDCDNNSIPDICEPGGSSDCDNDGQSDLCELVSGAPDCNTNLTPDNCDVAAGNVTLSFDDVDDRVRVPRSSSLEPGSLTVELWAYFNSLQSRNTRLVRKLSTNGYLLAADQDQDQRVQFRLHTPSLVFVKDTQSHSAYVGQWHHFAGVYTPTAAMIYVDGVLKNTTAHTSGPLPHSNVDLYIAAGLPASDPSEFFGGKIDEVRIWNVARTGAQIAADMHKSYATPQPGLVGYWKFNAGSGQTAVDSSGFNNHGTLGTSADPDASDPAWVAAGPGPAGPADCNGNGVPDACDLAAGTSQDCNNNNIPDTCETDCNNNGIADPCDIASGTPDCNANGIPDSCDIAAGTVTDVNTNGIPDPCEPDIRIVPVITILNPANTSEVRNAEPTSQSAVVQGSQYFVEVWASDLGGVNTGLTGVYVDMSYCAGTSATALFHGNTFTTFPSGTIIANGVDEFGGSALPNGGGIAPQWVRVGWVRMTAGPPNAACAISLAPSSGGVGAFGRGLINWTFVQLASASVQFTPTTVSYDLDNSLVINIGDLALWAPSWLQNAPPAPEAHDFDCDGAIGPADLSWFATGWMKPVSDPTILYPPCTEPPPTPDPPGFNPPADAELRVIARLSPSGSDLTTSLPASITSVPLGGVYYVELWASDIGDINTGFTSVYADVAYPAAASGVMTISHGGIFTLFASGAASNGLVNELGGSALPGGQGVQPQWVRIAIVQMSANGPAPNATFVLQPSATGVASYARGAIPWSDIVLTPVSLTQGVRGDIDGDNDVDPVDLNLFVGVLLGSDTDPAHAAAADMDGSATSDGRDVNGYVSAYLGG